MKNPFKSNKKKKANKVKAAMQELKVLKSTLGDARGSSCGADPVIFTDTSATTLTAIARPQRKFQVQKAVLIATPNAAATAAGVVVVVDSMSAGMDRLFSANASMAIESFRPDSVSNFIEAKEIDAGTEIQVQYRIIGTMPAGGQIICTTSLFGLGRDK